nr:SDR family NAD(P)-dependent oxidoreductase [Acidimicrobiia bacterium]
MTSATPTIAKTAVVTGGSRGLGRAITAALADAGWRIVIDGRDGLTVTSAARAISGRTGAEVVAVPGDVTEPAHRAALV